MFLLNQDLNWFVHVCCDSLAKVLAFALWKMFKNERSKVPLRLHLQFPRSLLFLHLTSTNSTGAFWNLFPKKNCNLKVKNLLGHNLPPPRVANLAWQVWKKLSWYHHTNACNTDALIVRVRRLEMIGLRDHYSKISFPIKITSQELHSFSTSF